MKKENSLLNSLGSGNRLDDKDILLLIKIVREGISYQSFSKISSRLPFNHSEWSQFLHVSERTMLRYKKQSKTFDTLQSEKILQIALLMYKGEELFGDTESFFTWLETINVSMGKRKPKSLLDNYYGVQLVLDELGRIEHGVLA